MGRKALVSEKDVFEACDTLTAEGREVNATTLLAMLGAGSFTTIYKHLSTWQAARMASATPASTGEMPDSARTAFATAWKIAATEAARELAALREKAAEDVRVATKQFQEALTTIERLESDSEANEEKIESLTRRVAELEASLSACEKDNARLTAKNEQLELQLNAQIGQVERQQKDLEVERQRSGEAVKESSRLKGQLEAVTEQNNKLMARLPGK